jgi:DNA-directed RNA polymerase II subunit RPB1
METIISEDKVFVESFFAIPDEEIESKLHLQSPWLLCLELDRAKMIDRKLTMAYVAGRRAESFNTIYSSSGVKTIWKSLSFIVMY